MKQMCVRTAVALAAALTVAAPAAAQGLPVALSADETAWHLRVGLNVAALACREDEAAEIVAGYNAMLAIDRAPLAAALAGVEANYRARYGAAWQARDDADMTRLYNFYATPTAHVAFCATARVLVAQVATVEPGQFYAFARSALPQLEQAFAAPAWQPPAYAVAANARVPLAPGRPDDEAAPPPRDAPEADDAAAPPRRAFDNEER